LLTSLNNAALFFFYLSVHISLLTLLSSFFYLGS
jgi:hypothetical protein